MDKYAIQDKKYKRPYHYTDFDLNYYALLKKLKRLIEKEDFEKILDIGCGDSRLIWEFTDLDIKKKMYGIDTNEQAIAFAKAYNYEIKDNFSSSPLSEIKDKYNLIILSHVIEHVPDNQIRAFREEIYNKLSDYGKLIVAVPSDNIPLIAKHFRHYNIKLLEGHFKGFRAIQYYFLNKNTTFYRLIYRLSRKFSNFKFQKYLVAFAEKHYFSADADNCSQLIVVFKK